MNPNAGAFDPDGYDATAAATVPGYALLQDLIALAATAGLPPEPRVLDLGCGTGTGLLALARALPAATLIACDPVLPMLTATRARCASAGVEVRALHGTLDALGDEPPFDLIVCTLVMHFVPVEQRVGWLRAIKSRLRPGGKLLLTALTHSEEPLTDKRWAMLRENYGARHGVPPEALARRQAQTAAQVVPVLKSVLITQLREAGFGAATPLYQLLAVQCWSVDAATDAARIG